MSIPDREVIHSSTKAAHLRLQYGLALMFFTLGVLWLVLKGNAWLGFGYLGVASAHVTVALGARRRRLELDADGLRLVDVHRSTYLPWADIVDVRGNAGPWSE